jgi:hypothetical protein
MPTEIKTATIASLVVAFLMPVCLYSQDSTVNIKPFERYWTKPRVIPKIGLGVQETAFVEAGIQFHKIYIHPLSLASAGAYFTVDGMLDGERIIIGPKVGYEITAGLLGVAVDITYYSDFDREALLFTPRAGLSIMGFVDLFYGRNLAISEFQFESIDKNRFSLVFNVNADYFNLRNAPKKIRKKDK